MNISITNTPKERTYKLNTPQILDLKIWVTESFLDENPQFREFYDLES